MLNKILIMALIAVSLMCSGLMDAPTRHVEAVYYVQPNVTLWEVASDYMSHQDKYKDVRELIADIREKNNMESSESFSEKWQPGQEIVIPLEVRDK